jgi:hypothetical protein
MGLRPPSPRIRRVLLVLVLIDRLIWVLIKPLLSIKERHSFDTLLKHRRVLMSRMEIRILVMISNGIWLDIDLGLILRIL